MARTVEDAALLLGVLAGPDEGDQATAGQTTPLPDYIATLVRTREREREHGAAPSLCSTITAFVALLTHSCACACACAVQLPEGAPWKGALSGVRIKVLRTYFSTPPGGRVSKLGRDCAW